MNVKKRKYQEISVDTLEEMISAMEIIENEKKAKPDIKTITSINQTRYNTLIRFQSNDEAELVKLFIDKIIKCETSVICKQLLIKSVDMDVKQLEKLLKDIFKNIFDEYLSIKYLELFETGDIIYGGKDFFLNQIVINNVEIPIKYNKIIFQRIKDSGFVKHAINKDLKLYIDKDGYEYLVKC